MRKYLLLLLLPALLLSCKSQAERELTGRFETMKKSAEFGTVEYTVKKLIKANDVGKWYAIGDRKILFSCTAYLKAGIDLEEFTMEDIEINGNSVHVTFPHAMSHFHMLNCSHSTCLRKKLNLSMTVWHFSAADFPQRTGWICKFRRSRTSTRIS